MIARPPYLPQDTDRCPGCRKAMSIVRVNDICGSCQSWGIIPKEVILNGPEAEATPSFHSAVDREPRCWRCRKKLAVFLTRPWEIDCVRCKATNARTVGSKDAV